MIALYVVAVIAFLIIFFGAFGGGSTPDVPWDDES